MQLLRLACLGLLVLGAVQAMDDPTVSLEGVHDLSEWKADDHTMEWHARHGPMRPRGWCACIA